MAIKGLTIIETMDESRVNEICSFILSLDFVKSIMVDICITDDEDSVQAKVSRSRYIVRVNPKIALDDIKTYLISKKYITA